MNKWWWVAGAVVLLLAAGGSNKQVRAFVMTPRGIRNNNPGNIRHGSAWQGMAPEQTDSDFVQFLTPVYGVRALARVLHTYANTHNLKTVRGIISRWAPPNENNTEAYINSVANKLGVSPDQPLTFERGQLVQLVEAIIKHENGAQPYDTATIVQGIQKAGWA